MYIYLVTVHLWASAHLVQSLDTFAHSVLFSTFVNNSSYQHYEKMKLEIWE